MNRSSPSLVTSFPADILGVIDDLCHVRQSHCGALAVADDQRAIEISGKKLVVGRDADGLPIAVDFALGGVEGRLRKEGADNLRS